MLALCWSETMLQADSVRSMASHGKSGSAAPALQRAKAPVLGLNRKKFPDNIELACPWQPNKVQHIFSRWTQHYKLSAAC
jgi:hypothetical protein